MTHQQYARAIDIKSQINIFKDYISTINDATSLNFKGNISIAVTTKDYDLKKVMVDYLINRIAELEKEFEDL